MNLNFQHLLPQDFDAKSRVWIYQSNRMFSLSEALEIEEMLNEFCEEWSSHGSDVKAYGNLLFGHFILLMADETQAGVSGCSTDSSVRFIKQIEQKFAVQLFERTNLAFVVKDKIEILPLQQLKYAVEHQFINEETPYFNNVVQTKKELEEQWIKPVKETWLMHKISSVKAS